MNKSIFRNTLLAIVAATLLPVAASQARSVDKHDDAAWSNDPRVKILGRDDASLHRAGRHDRDEVRPAIFVRDADAPLAFRYDHVDYLFYKGRFYTQRGRHLRVVDAPVRVSEIHHESRPRVVMVPVR